MSTTTFIILMLIIFGPIFALAHRENRRLLDSEWDEWLDEWARNR